MQCDEIGFGVSFVVGLLKANEVSGCTVYLRRNAKAARRVPITSADDGISDRCPATYSSVLVVYLPARVITGRPILIPVTMSTSRLVVPF